MLSLIKVRERIWKSSECGTEWKVKVSLEVISNVLFSSKVTDLDESSVRRINRPQSLAIGNGNFIWGNSKDGI